MGKILEHLIKDRLDRELTEKGGLAPNQYGFTKGKSTTDTALYVCRMATERTWPEKSERWCVLVTLDIRNAFNSASWEKIIKELRERHISHYLLNIIIDYLNARKITIDRETYEVTAGIPQGSVLGPLLWNVLYDPILRIDYGEGIKVVGYADDLVLIVKSNTRQELMESTNQALYTIKNWLDGRSLSLAPEKTEAVILNGKRKRDGIKFYVDNILVTPSKSVKYLGITIGENLYFGKYVETTVKKAGEKLGALLRLMPNIGGPNSAKRTLLNGVVQSVILYGAEVWSGMIRIKKYGQMLTSIQRRTLLRIASGYRTVSAMAIQVVAGIPPIDLLILERQTIKNDQDESRAEARKRAKESTMDAWQQRWEEPVKGQRSLPWMHGSSVGRTTEKWDNGRKFSSRISKSGPTADIEDCVIALLRP